MVILFESVYNMEKKEIEIVEIAVSSGGHSSFAVWANLLPVWTFPMILRDLEGSVQVSNMDNRWCSFHI